MKCAEEENPQRQNTDKCCQWAGGRGLGSEYQWVGLSLGDDVNVLKLGRGDGCTPL